MWNRISWKINKWEEYNTKKKKKEEGFNDVLNKPLKVVLTLTDFENTLQKYKNNILKEKQDSIITHSRYRISREIVEEIIMNNNQLKLWHLMCRIF